MGLCNTIWTILATSVVIVWPGCLIAVAMTEVGHLSANSKETQGPSFVKEPPDFVDFSNITGVTIECAAAGHPPPQVTWVVESGEAVTNLAEVRQVLPGGELVFPAFKAEHFRQDVHAAIYRCVATNAGGTILSRNVRVRAVVPQPYDIQVYDVYAIVKTTAVLKCHVPAFLEEHVRVTMWLRDEVLMIEPNGIMDGKYAVLPTGELHIRDVEMDDTGSTYRCHVKHRLTGETHFSSASGRLYVTDPQTTVAPKITDIRPAVHVSEGATVVLPCVAQGHPAPKAEWFAKLNKRQLFPLHIGERVQQTSGALIIHRAQTSDSGTYVCDVSNEAGSERGETTVTVTAPLVVSVKPDKQVVDIGREATFRCIVTGFPVLSVTWYKDGKKVQSEEGVRSVSDETVRLESIHVTDKGMYQCMANNALESAQGAAQLVLGDASPEFVSVFDDVISDPGGDASLKCVATGSPAPKIKWFMDGVEMRTSNRVTIQEATDDDGNVYSELNVTKVAWEEGGGYKCSATNKAGQAEHSARLNVVGRPSIRNMSRVTAVAGDDVRLNCLYFGHPIESILWEKDGRPLPYNLRQVAFPNGTVLIRKVQRASDSGQYTCTVSNIQGETGQQHVQLTVMVPPKIVPFTFQDEHLLAGMLVRVSCVVSRGDLPLSIGWQKDSLPVIPPLLPGVTVRTFDEYSSVLSIDPLSPAHSGNYTCLASNHAATATFTAPLVVYVPPRWTIEPKNVAVLLEHTLLVDCQADGFPKPKVNWMKTRGTTVGEHVDLVENSADLSVLANGSMSIEHAREHHRGHYFCKASNGIGDGLSTAVLIGILVPPRFDVKFRNQTLKRGEGFRLECPPAGDTPMTFVWKKDGVALIDNSRYQVETVASGGQSRLTVQESSRSDTGVYTCSAKNSYGSDQSTLQITVLEPPDPPSEIQVREIRSRSAEVTWEVPFDGNSRISKYVIEFSKDEFQDGVADMAVSGANNSAILHSLVPATKYHVRLFAENTIGLSKPSELAKFVTAEEAPAGPPLDVEAEAVDANTVIVRWKPPKPELWMGRLRGYNVGFKLVDSSPPYTFQVVKTGEEVAGDNYTAVLTNLKKYTKYSVSVSAYTSQGDGPVSDEVFVTTFEDVPEEAPSDVRCTPLTSQSVHVTWQPPPGHTHNGILRGYKVLFDKAEELPEDTGYLHKSTSVVRTTMHGLEKYTNYSIRVAGFTQVGDGVPSEPVHCRTLDDVPDIPADVKAVTASKESVLVAWKAPLHSNGVVTKYHVYAKHADDPQEDAIKHTVPPSALYHELAGLKTNEPYEFWVTAATMIGESPRSKMVAEAPQGPIVPARIAAFSGLITTLWKKYIKLSCKAVGNPGPDRTWTSSGNQAVKENDRLRILPDGTLMLKNVQWSDSGNYTCRVRNGFGQDQVVYVVNVLAPPSAPLITVSETSGTSIGLDWRLETDGGTNVQGYTLNYKRDLGHWEQVDLAPDSTEYTLNGLKCGSQYQMYMTAFNKIGTGSPSEVVTIPTNGTIPSVPGKEELINENVGSVTFKLHEWKEPCPITAFKIELRQSQQDPWKLLAEDVNGEQHNYVIDQLVPGTPYNFRVTAYNGAGSTKAEYSFVTITRSGDRVSPHNTMPEETRGILFYLDLRIIIPVAALVLVVLLILSVMCVCANRRDNADRKMKGVDGVTQNGPSRPNMRNDSTVGGFAYMQRHRTSGDGTILRDSQEKPIPYAVPYHLPNLRSSAEFKTFGQSRSNHAANNEKSPTLPPPPPNVQNNQQEVENDNNTHAMRHFTRQSPNLQGYPSPNGKRTVHPVAIPTAPPLSGDATSNSSPESQPSPASTGSLRRLPDIPPKPNNNTMTMETRFSPPPPDKVTCRVIAGPQSGPETGLNNGNNDWNRKISSSPVSNNTMRTTFCDDKTLPR